MQPGINYIGISTAFFCHDGEGNFLFHKRSQNCRDEHNTWDCGGGQLEFGETVEEGLLRELKEEYGCEGIIEKQLPTNSFFGKTNGKKRHWLIIPFIVRIQKGEEKIGEPQNVDEIGWFSLNNLPTPMHPGVKEDMEKYWNILKKHIENT
ncbi:MAG: NUDIX domain-containing protein [Candidatus Magasanikbacteria bacterium]|jgi:8-oxo-dGTP diphosphatase|nr:NUDIX domain-containing protein [Candidatus Magasanikbacteria bacterium]MBT4221001.1 NUDIX domain-containing protein [Candidatus Magasanikbacteria bacterium]MBT4350519.1 NUDIX domain-containing protein [Candidatus Magasanikbacteria bacterium]MBT4541928.1 NUDIX domain-containing protein [Candidatus Magasanikbacteria bacterium]MBT6253059.1 NUDIX domain-containing protein [Candidatus Magasanikbacteria bacterium]